ncbi:MAG: metallophosphoesterase [Halobacteriales archaeon]
MTMAATPEELAFVPYKRAAYLSPADTVVLADIHVGRDRTSDIELGLGERTMLIEAVTALIERFEPNEVVFAGDTLHSFSRVPVEVERTFEAIVEAATATGATLTILRGNHDTQLSAVIDDERSLQEGYRLADGDTVVHHGHVAPERTADRYVIGHDHPAIEIEGQRRPCYLLAEDVYDDADVLALPAFNPLIQGVAVNGTARGDLQSPLLERIGRFKPIVHDAGEDGAGTLTFPRLSSFREFL